MTLFSIALKNIKRNFYNYFLYFVSMIFSIMIYYVFTSIQYNQQVLELTIRDAKIDAVFQTSSIVIAIFAAIFIWYSNSFFIRKRKKEVALYSLMGVRKRQVGRMLFYENILMGILALAAGIFLGSLLSKVFIMLLVNLMGYAVNVKFAIMPQAIKDTVFIFAILFLVTSIHGYAIIYRFKLIDLFQAEKKGEKKPKGSIVAAILAILFIGGGYTYYLSVSHFTILTPILTLVLVVIGTYFFFSSLTVFIIKLLKRNKKRYYKGINMIGTSQLFYRIKRHSRTLATIAVLSATTLTAMGVTSSFYYDVQTKLDNRYPFSYAYVSKDINLNKEIESVIAKFPKNKISNSVEFEFIKTEVIPVGGSSRLGIVYAISESKFNNIAKVRGLNERISLNTMDESVLIDEFFYPGFTKSYTGESVGFNVNGNTLELKIADFKTYSLLNERMVSPILIVKDGIYKKFYNEEKIIRGKGYIVKNEKESKELTDEINKLYSSAGLDEGKFLRKFTDHYSNYRAGLVSSGLTIFIGAFLGLVFLLATGSIIFFKQLSEAHDDKKRYRILKNIGIDRSEIKKSISKQILCVFALPLLVGTAHSLVAVSILGIVLKMELTVPISITLGAYTLIYTIYYFLTVNAYSKIVNAKG